VRELTIADPGPLTTVQDLGRRGLAHLGVPRAGALDTPAAGLANRLVGNPAGAAVLETTMGGVTFSVAAAMTLAVTGAPSPVSVDGRSVAFGEAVSLREGEVVAVGPATAGVRAYVAFAGGISVEPVLGSRSTDTLAMVGPPVPKAGAVLPVGPAYGVPGDATPTQRRPTGDVLLRYDPGPRADWLEPLPRAAYTVAEESNRVGLRLAGDPLARIRHDELPSEGIVLGAVQVPASGQPLVFLNDHPTTGGYPVVAVVAPEDLPRCAQLRPGDTVRFLRR
jgi:biotin-dependent carboxylase-like uncharacterized protein